MTMKKYFFLSLLIILVLMPAVAFSQVAGKLTRVEGRVDILRTGTEAAVPANTGDSLSIGDILRTKSDGRAEITFIDNSVMSLSPKSRLGIDEYLYKPGEDRREASLKLYRGKSGFKVPKAVYSAAGSKFEMKTRTAVAGVRGTEGIIYTGWIERVYVKHGIVEFYNLFGSVTVKAGQVGEVMYGRAPVERPYNDNEYKGQERGDAAPVVPPPPPPPAGGLLPQLPAIVSLPGVNPPVPLTDVTGAGATTDVNINIKFP